MRILLVTLFMFFPILVGTSNPANAAPPVAGCAAINLVLGKVPKALETFKYYENIRFNFRRWGVVTETYCREFTFLKDLKSALTQFCSMLGGIEGIIPSNPLVSAINGKFASIGTKLSAVGNASSINDPATLGSYISNKVTSIDGDMKDLFNLMPKLNINETGRWIPIGSRKSCITTSGAPPTAAENNAENKALAYAQAEEKVRVLQYKVNETQNDIAAKQVQITNANNLLAVIVARPWYPGRASAISGQNLVINNLNNDLIALQSFLAQAQSDLAAAIIVRNNARAASNAANAAL